MDAAGNLYVADSGNDRVLEYDSPLTPAMTPMLTPIVSPTPSPSHRPTAPVASTATPARLPETGGRPHEGPDELAGAFDVVAGLIVAVSAVVGLLAGRRMGH